MGWALEGNRLVTHTGHACMDKVKLASIILELAYPIAIQGCLFCTHNDCMLCTHTVYMIVYIKRLRIRVVLN